MRGLTYSPFKHCWYYTYNDDSLYKLILLGSCTNYCKSLWEVFCFIRHSMWVGLCCTKDKKNYTLIIKHYYRSFEKLMNIINIKQLPCHWRPSSSHFLFTTHYHSIVCQQLPFFSIVFTKFHSLSQVLQ